MRRRQNMEHSTAPSRCPRPTNNYTTNLPFTKTSNSYDIKIDYTPTEKNHLSGRYSYQNTATFRRRVRRLSWRPRRRRL